MVDQTDTEASASALVNDLDLEVQAPNGTTYLGKGGLMSDDESKPANAKIVLRSDPRWNLYAATAALLVCSLALGTALAHEDHDPIPDIPDEITSPTGIEDRPLPEDLEDVGNFGEDVAVHETGDLLAVGADFTDVGSSRDAGSVHVFERGEDGRWTQLASLTAPSPDPDGAFGHRVAFGPNTLAVGAPDMDAGDRSHVGLVFTYNLTELAGDEPPPETIHPPSDADAGLFGNSLALSDERLAVGDNGPGNIYLYERGEGSWELVTTFREDHPSITFGGSDRLALDGDLLVAGDTVYSNDSLPEDAGAVFVYQHDADTDTWPRVQTLTSPNPRLDGGFGRVALQGNTLAVGAAGAFTDHGRLHVFEPASPDRGNWSHQATFHPSGGSGNLGHTVAATESTILAGAPNEEAYPRGVDLSPFSHEVGAVYWYHATADGWEQTAFLRAPVPNPETDALDRFGRGLAIGGDHAIASSSGTVRHPEHTDPHLAGQEPDWHYPGRITVFGPDQDVDHLADTREQRESTPVEDPDADDDGLPDGIEIVRWLSDPHEPDTDGDGLTDGFEAWESKTQTGDADTDGDGFSDRIEVHGIERAGSQALPPSDPNDHRHTPLNPDRPLLSPYEPTDLWADNHRRDLVPTPPVDQPRHWPGYANESITDWVLEGSR